MHPDLLPDCRARASKTISRGMAGLWTPIFCANCGTAGGAVPTENVTFLFYLCDPCAETYGRIAGTMLMPDEVFFEKLRQEQLERYGRYLGLEELAKVSETPSHPLWTLLKERLADGK